MSVTKAGKVKWDINVDFETIKEFVVTIILITKDNCFNKDKVIVLNKGLKMAQ